MDRDTWLHYYDELPTGVQTYLLDVAAAQHEADAQAKLAYDNDAWDRVMDVVWEVLFAKLSKEDFQEKLKRLAGDRKAQDVEKEILFNIVLPLADIVVWDVEARLQDLGVTMGQLQTIDRVSLRPVSYSAAIRRIASRAKIGVLGEELVRRLREILVSYVKSVRTIEQCKAGMQKAQGEGGLGFTRDQADAFGAAMDDFLATSRVMSEQEFADWYARYQREQESLEIEKKTKGATVGGEDAEVASMATRGPKASPGAATALDAAVQSAVLQANGNLQLDAFLQTRLENIVSTRLRDVRNEIQMRAMLERDVKVGGLGLTPDIATQIGDVIEKVYAEQRATIDEEQKKQIDSTMQEQKGKIEERKKRESEEHAQWFKSKVKGTERDDQAMQAMRQMMQGGAAERGTRNAERQAVPSDVAAPLAGASVSVRPQVDGIIPPTKLIGLTEELGGLTLAEFRRMAKSPEQAAEKIRQKFEALKQESFDRWTEGIQFWRNSPLQQQYLKLVAESFSSGKPVAQLAEEKRLQDPSVPTTDELGAIIQLNSQIQF